MFKKGKSRKKKAGKKRNSDDSRGSLGGAINTLEDILEDQHVAPDGPDLAGPEGDEVGEGSLAEPEIIPLLNNVIVPGQALNRSDGPVVEDVAMQEELPEIPPHDDLVLRLVNELEIIIEGRVDEALASAKKDLMASIKNHLEIVLPEMLDELERRKR